MIKDILIRLLLNQPKNIKYKNGVKPKPVNIAIEKSANK